MYIRDGIAYAGNPEPMLSVNEAVPFGDRKLLLTFNDGSIREFDGKTLTGEAFKPLRDKQVFDAIVLDHGIPTWCNGEVDISPDYLYSHSKPIKDQNDLIET